MMALASSSISPLAPPHNLSRSSVLSDTKTRRKADCRSREQSQSGEAAVQNRQSGCPDPGPRGVHANANFPRWKAAVEEAMPKHHDRQPERRRQLYQNQGSSGSGSITNELIKLLGLTLRSHFTSIRYACRSAASAPCWKLPELESRASPQSCDTQDPGQDG